MPNQRLKGPDNDLRLIVQSLIPGLDKPPRGTEGREIENAIERLLFSFQGESNDPPPFIVHLFQTINWSLEQPAGSSLTILSQSLLGFRSYQIGQSQTLLFGKVGQIPEGGGRDQFDPLQFNRIDLFGCVLTGKMGVIRPMPQHDGGNPNHSIVKDQMVTTSMEGDDPVIEVTVPRWRRLFNAVHVSSHMSHYIG